MLWNLSKVGISGSFCVETNSLRRFEITRALYSEQKFSPSFTQQKHHFIVLKFLVAITFLCNVCIIWQKLFEQPLRWSQLEYFWFSLHRCRSDDSGRCYQEGCDGGGVPGRVSRRQGPTQSNGFVTKISPTTNPYLFYILIFYGRSRISPWCGSIIMQHSVLLETSESYWNAKLYGETRTVLVPTEGQTRSVWGVLVYFYKSLEIGEKEARIWHF